MKTFVITTAQKMKRHIFIILGGLFALAALVPSVSVGQQFSDTDFPYEVNVTPVGADTTDLGNIVKEDTVNPSTSIIKRLTDFFRLT